MVKPTSPILTPEEMVPMRHKWEIRDAQAQKIFEWGNEPCPHGTKCADTSTACRFECPICRQELEEEVTQ